MTECIFTCLAHCTEIVMIKWWQNLWNMISFATQICITGGVCAYLKNAPDCTIAIWTVINVPLGILFQLWVVVKVGLSHQNMYYKYQVQTVRVREWLETMTWNNKGMYRCQPHGWYTQTYCGFLCSTLIFLILQLVYFHIVQKYLDDCVFHKFWCNRYIKFRQLII